MGAWGTSLYANDSASDIRGDYVDKLRRGMSNEKVTQELIENNWDIMGDEEEEPLFWYALADTQWNYGRLLPDVKEKALSFIGQDAELERWRDAGEKKLSAWMSTLEELKKKLLSPMPPEKKVSKYRLYQCKWKLGDVFAYRFDSDYSREKGFWGQYVVFRKVSEDTWWPGHIVPVVQVYKWVGDKIPLLDSLTGMKLLKLRFYPENLSYLFQADRDYFMSLISSTSERAIPHNNLTFLGNVPGNDLEPYRGYKYLTGYVTVGWEKSNYNDKFEHYIIDMFLSV